MPWSGFALSINSSRSNFPIFPWNSSGAIIKPFSSVRRINLFSVISLNRRFTIALQSKAMHFTLAVRRREKNPKTNEVLVYFLL